MKAWYGLYNYNKQFNTETEQIEDCTYKKPKRNYLFFLTQ